MTDITAEQVGRAIAAVRAATQLRWVQGFTREMSNGWLDQCPDYVRDAWSSRAWDIAHNGDEVCRAALLAALERWHAELVAAEARAAGAKAPVDDTSPHRLRERREALGWTLDKARLEAGIAFPCYVERCEQTAHDSNRNEVGDRERYISALEYEEQRRAKAFVRHGWMRLVDHPSHRPGKVVELTDEGRAVLTATQAARAKSAEQPQSEPWHARLLRLAQEYKSAREAVDAAEDRCEKAREAFLEASQLVAILEAAETPAGNTEAP